MSDPITVAVISSALRAIAWEMSEALRRSAHSPIIREMLDYSCGVFTAEGETVAQDELIPAFLGTMAATMPWVIDAAKEEELKPGDAFIANDPYRGGTHTPDIQVFMPIMEDGELIGWCGNIAHHSDVGGTNPGTEGYANSSIFEEGLRIPPIRFVDDGRINEALFSLIKNNIRDPSSTAGDLRAQLAACSLGQRRVLDLARRYSRPTLVGAMHTILDQSESRVRAAIKARPNGEARAEGWLDDDGMGGEPVRIAVNLSVLDDRVEVDLSQSDPQMAGGMNMSATSARSAIIFAVKAVFDPEMPQNGGVIRTVDVNLPEGCLANPQFPAAVSLRHLGVQRLADTLLRAFGELYPDLASAGSFVGFSSISAACRHPRADFEVIIQDDLGGGMGGHSGGDGLDAVDVYLGNVQMLPAEICEIQYPIRIVSTELVTDSGGAGEFRGGLGMRRVYEFLDVADGVFYTEQSHEQFAPYVVNGGFKAPPARMQIKQASGEVIEINKYRSKLAPGDHYIVTTAGGGGYGDPRRRRREAVLADLREGKITERAAREVYGLGGTDLELNEHSERLDKATVSSSERGR